MRSSRPWGSRRWADWRRESSWSWPVVEPRRGRRRRGARPTCREDEAGHDHRGNNESTHGGQTTHQRRVRRTGVPDANRRWLVDASRIYSVGDARRRAARAVPRALFDYIDGGADDEVTMAENRRAFSEVTFRPRMANATGEPQVSTTLLGTALSLPVLLAPCGLVRFMHPDGAPGVARAAAAAGTVSVLSTVAGSSLEEIADVRAGDQMVPAVLTGRAGADRRVGRARPGGGLRRTGGHPRHARSRTSRARRSSRGGPAVPVHTGERGSLGRAGRAPAEVAGRHGQGRPAGPIRPRPRGPSQRPRPRRRRGSWPWGRRRSLGMTSPPFDSGGPGPSP